jgi:phosphatidylserine/phosphatidylglycerophosphate/cardiolipin synthase-like enzyme
MKNQIQVVVTGLAWMGSGIGSIESAMERIFHEAEHEVSITSYAISQAPDRLLEWFEGALMRGIMIRIIINHFNEQPAEVIERLKQFGQNYPHFLLYDFSGDERNDLHAKVVVADRRLALIGSSNLSNRGLLTNHELAILVEGPSAGEVAQALDKLLASSLVNRVGNFS